MRFAASEGGHKSNRLLADKIFLKPHLLEELFGDAALLIEIAETAEIFSYDVEFYVHLVTRSSRIQVRDLQCVRNDINLETSAADFSYR